jgi:hypothetical protein
VRRISIIAATVPALLALAGCGSSDPPETPTACLSPASSYVVALEGAPDEVLLDGTTPIGDCLVADQEPGQIATVGASIVGAATELNREVRRDPDPQRIAALGYLVGAVQEAEASTGGIHADLKLRLDAAARYTGEGGKPFGAEFERAFGEGYAAGQAGR